MDFIPIDYETLRLIWWALLGVLPIGFAVMGGMDLGIGTLLPAVARTDDERRVLLNLVGPTWEGNQVWLVLGAGSIFAAWPPLYAVSFSGFYLAMIVILFALILRPVGFKYRGKIADPRWRATWDWILFIGGFVPSLIFGVAIGNVLLGVPFDLDATLRPSYAGNFFGLLTPFALLCGLVSVSMLIVMGASVIAARTEGDLATRAVRYGQWAAIAAIVLFAAGGVWIAFGIDGYVITSTINTALPSNPLVKTVTRETGVWMANFGAHPWMILAPVLGFAGMAVAAVGLKAKMKAATVFAAAVGVIGIVSTAGLAMFPFLLPSSVNPTASLTVWDASSSHLTLFIMLIATAFFLPIIVAYTSWVYKIMSGPVTSDSLSNNPNAY